jgi:hypothetical protein
MQLSPHSRHDQVGLDAEKGQRTTQLERALGHLEQERRDQVLRLPSLQKRFTRLFISALNAQNEF